MRLLKNFRIKHKIIIIIIIIGTVSAITGNIINYMYELRNTKTRLIENSTLHAKLIAENCWLPLEFNYPKNAADELQKLHTIPEVQDAVLYNYNDTVFASYNVTGNVDFEYPKELKNSGFYIDGDNLYINQTVVHNDKIYGTIYLHSNINWSSIVTSRLVVSFIMVVLMLLFVVLFAFILQGSISQPIIELSYQMSVVAQKKDYTVQLKNTDKDEVGELYSEFNNMLSEINKRENELKNTFEALRKSEALQNKMVSNIGDVIVIIDQNGINQYKSPNITRLFGWNPEELVGQSTWDNVHPADLESAQQFVGTIFNEHNATGTIEIRYKHKNGEYVWIEVTLFNLMSDPDIQGLLGNYHEITERRQTQVALKESEERFRDLSNLLPQAIFETDINGKITYVNQIGYKLFGISSEDLISGLSTFDLLIPEERDIAKSRMTEVISENKPMSYEYTALRKDGSTFPVIVYSNASIQKNQPTGLRGLIFDITERKIVESEMVELYKKLAVLNQLVNSSLKSASVGAWWIDFAEHDTFHALDTTISLLEMSVNDKGDEYKISEWVEVLLKSKMLNPEFAQIIDHTLEQFTGTISGKYEVYRAEYPVLRRDNSIRWIDTRADVSQRDANGKALNMTGTLIDITDRKLAEKALNENQRFIANLISNLSGMVYRCKNNADWTMEFVSEGSFALTGYKPIQLIDGKEIEYGDLIHKEDQKMVWETVQVGIQAKQPYLMEYRIKDASGVEKWVWEQGCGVYSEFGDLIGLEGFITDITERKFAEKELDKYRERLEELVVERTQDLQYSLSLINAAMDSTADGILVVNKNGHISRWNQKFVDLWHVPQDLLVTDIKDPVLSYVTKQMADPDMFLSKVMELYEHPEATSKDMLKLADSRIFERYSQPQRIGDEIVGRVWSFRNITEQKRAEENLQKAKELAEAANNAKSIFLANMTHEIRTPMNAVLGFAQLLVRDTALSNESLNKVRTIIKSGEHLLGIINEILEVSRIEAGRVEIRSESLDLYSLLNDLGVMFRMQAETKSLSFSLHIGDDLPRYIIADMGKLRQILVNLLGNAVKFTQHGSISLNAYSSGTDRVTIVVKDTGIGISPEEQQNLFRPFERTRSGEQVAGGTGLGLVISREYAHLMEGEIILESEINQGSAFLFEFHAPTTAVLPVSSEITHRVTALSPNQETINVLIVDDQKTNRDLLRFILEPLGFIVDEAVSGEEGVSKACTNLPRIILMDMVMPGMSGIEATKIIRTTCIMESTTIIGVSASAFEKEKQNFMDAGINAFIAKPFHEQELFDLLTKHAGVLFETEELKAPSSMQVGSEVPTFEKMPTEWRQAFAQALAQGSITRIKQLSEAAKEYDAVLSAYMLNRVDMYDLNGLKKLS